MKTLPLSEAKANLSALVKTLQVTSEEVVITKNGQPAAVLVSPEEFEGWRETVAIKSDHDLMVEIKQGLAASRRKKTRLYTLTELFD